MNKLKRDLWILSPYLKRMGLQLLFINLSCLAGTLYLYASTGEESYFIPSYLFLLYMLLAVNGSVLVTLTMKYIKDWKPEIEEEFKKLELENKYSFFMKRFE